MIAVSSSALCYFAQQEGGRYLSEKKSTSWSWSRDCHWESGGWAFLGRGCVSDKSSEACYLISVVQIYVVDVSVLKPSISNIVLIDLSNNKRPFLHNLRRTGSSQIVEGLKWTSKRIKLLNEMSFFFSSVILSFLVPTYSTILHGIPYPPPPPLSRHLDICISCARLHKLSRIARFAETFYRFIQEMLIYFVWVTYLIFDFSAALKNARCDSFVTTQRRAYLFVGWLWFPVEIWYDSFW